MKNRFKIGSLVAIDIFLINISIALSLYMRFEGNLKSPQAIAYMNIYVTNAVAFTIIKIIIFYLFGMYKSLWRYASISEVTQIVGTLFVATSATLSYTFIIQSHLPRSIYLLSFILDIVLIGGIRFAYRLWVYMRENHIFNTKKSKRIMVVGAGQAGAMVIKELRNHSELNSKPVALIDDDESKIGRNINGVPVEGDHYHIRKVAQNKNIDEIIVAIPSASKKEISQILDECSRTKCKLKILPGMYELIDEKVSLKQIRDVAIEDLLGREPVKVNMEQISTYIKNKVVLVTGGGGSIGSELCRQICEFEPKQIIIFDIYENNAYEIQNELKRKYDNLNITVLIGSVRDRNRINEIFSKYEPQIVFHAAAHKHVPLMEDSPKEAIKNNVFGTLNVAEMADEYKCEKFVLISTDKAVNPTNVMGATKRIAEMIIQAIDKKSSTEFVAVRFGNVLGSNGSVIPLFKEQILKGGPVTVTHKDIIRYFMTIPEAVQLVIQAGSMAKGGEIFVLDMGEPVKILDLAENLIRLSGFEPYEDINIEITGLRPGEKLYEELLMAEEGLAETRHEKIFIGKPNLIDFKLLIRELENLRHMFLDSDDKLKEYVEHIVPTYMREAQ